MLVWLNNLFSIFTKPEILWSKADHFQAFLCYVICGVGVAIVIAVVAGIIWLICKIKNKIEKRGNTNAR